MKTKPSDKARAAILARVVSAIERNRAPGYHFAGHFLGLSFGAEHDGFAAVSLNGKPLFVGPEQVEYSSCALLADIAMARAIRTELKEAVPIATVHIHLQFTGHAQGAVLAARGRSRGFLTGSSGRQALATVDVTCGSGLICFGSAAFMPLGAPPGFTLPVPIGLSDKEDRPVSRSQLSPEELQILERAEAALDGDDSQGSFLDRFWGFRCIRTAHGGQATLENGAHVSNRMGHAQGGLLLGLAIKAGFVGLPPNWTISAITASYVSPGEGQCLAAEARVVHRGARTATIRSVVTNGDGRLVVESLLTAAKQV